MSGITPEMALFTMQATSAASDAVSKYSSARAARTQARVDASLADVEASDALNRAATDAARVQARGRRNAGSVRSQAAGSGFTTGAGTAADMESAAEFLAGLDAATIREQGRREALGHETRAAMSRAEAKSISPWADATGSLIGGASKVAGYWLERKTNPFKKK